jgi:valacyclovir hydrolase
MHTTGTTVQVGGAAIHVQTMGDPDARPILFLHGGAGSLAEFEDLYPGLDEFCCVFMDLRGHGRSTLGKRPMSYPQLADDVEAVIDALDLDRPVLLGHSDGGTAALEVAARGRVAINGVITLSARAWRPRPSVLETHIGRMTPELFRRTSPAAVADYEAINPEADFDRFFTQVAGMWRDVGDGNYPGDRVERIRCQTLVLGGEHDHLVSVEETIALARAIPHAHLGIVPYGSHSLHAEQPGHIQPFICDFMLFMDDYQSPHGEALIPQAR